GSRVGAKAAAASEQRDGGRGLRDGVGRLQRGECRRPPVLRTRGVASGLPLFAPLAGLSPEHFAHSLRVRCVETTAVPPAQSSNELIPMGIRRYKVDGGGDWHHGAT